MCKVPSSVTNNNSRPYSTPLIFLALQIVFLSALFSFYDVQIPVGPALVWIREIPVVSSVLKRLENSIGPYLPAKIRLTTLHKRQQQKTYEGTKKSILPKTEDDGQAGKVFTAAQLAMHDGSDPSKVVYLALLGRVFDVDKGKKHYGKGGAYQFFAGKDATRSFVTGDFSSKSLNSDISDLSDSELLGVQDWMTFYQKEYKELGTLSGPYYDEDGKPTKLLKMIIERLELARERKADLKREQEIFPPCNSEWKKGTGGRVWCTKKSGGVERDWVGVPRKLYNPGAKHHKCVCVKNFGDPLIKHGAEDETGRGDLGHSGLSEYDDCAPDSNSCRIPA